MTPRILVAAVASVAFVFAASVQPRAQTSQQFSIRGHSLTLRLYGPASGDPVIVSSGDGGWIHVAPHVAETLARRGFFIVGVDARAYLTSFTSGSTALDPNAEPGDYALLADYAQRTTGRKPILVGVSEGAGLSLLAAIDPGTQRKIAGVLGIGLPDVNELGWRWRDSMIYLTHKVPNEPTFSTAAIASRVSPVPLAAIHATGDEFVPVADIQRIMGSAREPKRLWILNASNHRFSDNLTELDARLLEAIEWIRQNAPR